MRVNGVNTINSYIEFNNGEQYMEGSVGYKSLNYVSNFGKQTNNHFSQVYNPGWRNHPNFSWKQNQGQQPFNNQYIPGFQQQQQFPL